MLQSIKSVFSFLKSAYSESTGEASSTRLHIGLIVGFVLATGTSLGVLVLLHRITVDDLCKWMQAAAVFLPASTGSLYGLNVLKNKQNGQ
jgi:hypothetical protein